MVKVRDGFFRQVASLAGSDSYLLKAGGGYIGVGNASGNVPLSNGTVNANLNADLLDGKHYSDIISDTDSKYVLKAGDTMTGTLKINIDSATSHIAFTRASYNYITAATSGGMINFITNGLSITSANSTLILSGRNGYPGTTNVGTWGSSSNRWSNVYSVLGNFSGQITSTVATGTAPLKVTSTTLVSNLNADKLDNYEAVQLAPRVAYSYSNGCLVKLKIPSTKNAMILVHIRGNTYSTSTSVYPINTIVQFYNYNTNDQITRPSGMHFGYAFGNISAFVLDEYVHIWFKQSSSSQTMVVEVYSSSTTTAEMYNCIDTITNAAMPTEGVTRLVEITPITSNQTFYKLTFAAGKFTAGDYTPNVAAKTINIPTKVSDLTDAANYVTTNTAQTISAKKTFSVQQAFTVADGTAPFTVTSKTAVTNLNADMLDGIHSSGFAKKGNSVSGQNINNITSESGFLTVTTNSHAVVDNGFPVAQAGLLIYGSGAYSGTLQIYGTYSSNKWYARGGGSSSDSTYHTAWREFLFTDSTINATKLATARTLWGQSFDGSANVSGNMSSVGNISGTYFYVSNSSSNPYYRLTLNENNWYVQALTSYLYVGPTSSKAIRIDQSGNTYIPGNTGIGVTSPSYKLHVSGDVYSTNQLISAVATGTAPLKVTSTTYVANLNADMLDGKHASDFLTISSLDDYVTLGTTQTISGVKTFSKQQKFTVATGTSPFTVTSTTYVANLNADMLDGKHASDFLTTSSLDDYVTLSTAQTISGVKTFSKQQKFTVATGTSPFTVNSTTYVQNLNADMLDGKHYSDIIKDVDGKYVLKEGDTMTGPLYVPMLIGQITWDDGTGGSYWGINPVGGANFRWVNAEDEGTFGSLYDYGSLQVYGNSRLNGEVNVYGRFTAYDYLYAQDTAYFKGVIMCTPPDGSPAIRVGGTNQAMCSGLNADMLDGSHGSDFVTLTTAQTISGVKTFSKQQKFTVATGTAPFTVTSTTYVPNLNADMLDGKHASDFLTSSSSISATQLKTARKLWGQSFDGTADVSGNMTDVGSINNVIGEIKNYTGDAASRLKIYSSYLPNGSSRYNYIHFDTDNPDDHIYFKINSGHVGINVSPPMSTNYSLVVGGGGIYSQSFHHSVDSDNYVILAGGGIKLLSEIGGGVSGDYVTTNTAQNITAKKTFTSAPAFNVTVGSPFTVTQTVKVTNLNADRVDDLHFVVTSSPGTDSTTIYIIT